MKFWKALLIASCVGLLGIVCAAKASASIRPEVGAGLSNYSIVPDGAWYQLGAPGDKLQTHGRAVSVGVVGDRQFLDYFGVAFHADYVNLGHARSYCNCTSVDADYDHATRKIAAGSPMAVFSGDGLVQGIKLSIAPYVTVKGWKLGYERGLYFYRPQFVDSVYGWSATGAPPYQNLILSTPTGIRRARMFGFFVARGRFTVSYESYRMPVNWATEANPPLWTGAHLLLLSYAL